MTGRYYGKDHTPNFYPPYDPTSMREDFIFPAHSTGRGSLVETLPVDMRFDGTDLEYFQRKVWVSLKVPDSYLVDPKNDAAVIYHERRLAEIPAPTNVSGFTPKSPCDVQLSPEAMARVMNAVEYTLNVLAYDRAMEILD